MAAFPKNVNRNPLLLCWPSCPLFLEHRLHPRRQKLQFTGTRRRFRKPHHWRRRREHPNCTKQKVWPHQVSSIAHSSKTKDVLGTQTRSTKLGRNSSSGRRVTDRHGDHSLHTSEGDWPCTPAGHNQKAERPFLRPKNTCPEDQLTCHAFHCLPHGFP